MGRFKAVFPKVAGTEIFCDPNCCDWDSLTWGRWASGGSYSARHLFVDDWRLEHLWRKQSEGMLKAVLQGIVTAPDFTIELDFPEPFVAFQLWRSRVLSLFWQESGAIVVPVLQWGNPEYFPLCAMGITPGSVVAVRGPQKGTEAQWLSGMDFMLSSIRPALILHFGRRIQYPACSSVLFRPLRTTIPLLTTNRQKCSSMSDLSEGSKHLSAQP